jgi:hypothetical protein
MVHYRGHNFFPKALNALCLALTSLLHFRNLFYTDGRIAWTSVHPVARPLPTHRKTQNKRIHKHLSIYLICLIYLCICPPVPVASTWSIGHPWNASFHFSFFT